MTWPRQYFPLRLLAGILLLAEVVSAARANEVITNAADVLALPPTEASRSIPVAVTGVVTAAEPSWNGKFFIQDASGGVFVNNAKHVRPAVGDLVTASGVSFVGGYAPCITKPHWKKLGAAPLPAAKPVTIEQLMSGAEDSQRIEISGIIRNASTNADRLALELVSGGFRLRAYSPFPPRTDPQALVGARVRLQGTACTTFDIARLRHIVTVTLFVPRLDGFIIDDPSPASPFDGPLIPLNDIARYRRDSSPASQVHVEGVVTCQRKGEDLFLQDATGGLQIKTTTPLAVSPGDVVEAVGFPARENFLPVLEDARVRKTSQLPQHLEPASIVMTNLQRGLYHAALIRIQGAVLDRRARGIGQDWQTTLVLQNTNFLFVAETVSSDARNGLTTIPIGSLVEVSGVCFLESSEDGKIKSMRVLLPGADDVRILKRPDWLTPQRLLISLVAAVVVLIIALSWSVMVSSKNSILKSLVREKEAAQQELQQAHSQLEERVRERTNQLKVEMTARKESELQFHAVLTERTRLAQELHDTLEQTMVGIALQLNMVESHFEKNPGNSFHHLKLARNLMRQSRTYLRDSVRGLRSRAAEEFNLANALITSSQQIAGGAGIRVEVETTGASNSLSEIVEENLLRIGQEAVTNVVKHSGASHLKMELHYNPHHVVLNVMDDGKGFDTEHRAGPNEGHFGLLGMSERAERLGGQVMIVSAPGTGTSVRVEIPTPAANGAPA